MCDGRDVGFLVLRFQKVFLQGFLVMPFSGERLRV